MVFDMECAIRNELLLITLLSLMRLGGATVTRPDKYQLLMPVFGKA